MLFAANGGRDVAVVNAAAFIIFGVAGGIMSFIKKITDYAEKRLREETDAGARGDFYGIDAVAVILVVVGAFVFSFGVLLPMEESWRLFMMILATLLAGYNIILLAVVNIIRVKPLDENVLTTVAVSVAFGLGDAQIGAACMLLCCVGRLLIDFFAYRTRGKIEELVDVRSWSVVLVRDGKEIPTSAEEVGLGETILIRPGERIPLDCIILEGKSTLDLSALTGDSQPHLVEAEDEAPAGALNLTGSFTAEVAASSERSAAARKLSFVSGGFPAEKAAEKLPMLFSAVVLGLAVIAAVVLPLVVEVNYFESVRRALAFIIVACPGVFLASAPLVWFSGMGGAAERGVLFKSSDVMRAVSRSKAVVFDKSGTLTAGNLVVSAIKPNRMDADTMLRAAAHAGAYSEHPMARSLRAAGKSPIYLELIEFFEEFPAWGVSVKLDGKEISLGTREFLNSKGVSVLGDDFGVDIAAFMAVENVYAGRIIFSDVVKESAVSAVYELTQTQGQRVEMFSEDVDAISSKLAGELDIKEYYVSCTAQEKEERLREIRSGVGGDGSLLYVWNGALGGERVNGADVAVALDGLKSGAPYADVLVMDAAPGRVAAAIRAAKHARTVELQNAALAIFCKVVVLALAGFGFVNLWGAVIIDTAITIGAVISSARAQISSK